MGGSGKVDYKGKALILKDIQGNYQCAHLSLKALFNNVFTLKNLSCMALHAISVFGKV